MHQLFGVKYRLLLPNFKRIKSAYVYEGNVPKKKDGKKKKKHMEKAISTPEITFKSTLFFQVDKKVCR